MIRHSILTAGFLLVTACATTDPNIPETVASADLPTKESVPASSEGNVEVVEIPEVAKVTDIPVRDELVCTKERKTGSNRVKKVCRRRSAINSTAIEAKKTFDDLRRSQVEY